MGISAKYDAGGIALEEVYGRLEAVQLQFKPTRRGLVLVGLHRDQAAAEAGEPARQTVAVHAALPAELEEALVAWAYAAIHESAPLAEIRKRDPAAEHEARRKVALAEEEARLERLAELAGPEAAARQAKLRG